MAAGEGWLKEMEEAAATLRATCCVKLQQVKIRQKLADYIDNRFQERRRV